PCEPVFTLFEIEVLFQLGAQSRELRDEQPEVRGLAELHEQLPEAVVILGDLSLGLDRTVRIGGGRLRWHIGTDLRMSVSPRRGGRQFHLMES
ncbi:MAG: hypothetical protein HKM89_11290, partial [Gemmatimonadales bacterium]|nr:hypothetical protein [Gemmatimonadales bacterium]